MKKCIAAVLSAVMVFTTAFMGVSAAIGASAESDTEVDFTYIDFDNKTYNSYNDTDSGMAKAYVSLVDSGDKDHGKVIEITQLSSTDNAWPQTVAVLNYDGTSRFKIKKGEKYTITLDYNVIKISDALQIGARFVPETASAGNAGAYDDNPNKYLFWMSAATEVGWKTATTAEFEAPCDGTVLLSTLSWAGNINDQKVYIDNIRLERKIIADDTSINVKYNYNYDGKTETKKAYLGASYSFAVRKGYVFDGWYIDSELAVPAPSTVRKSCTELYAKWSPDNRVAQTTVNTYDDADMTFSAKQDTSGTVFYLNKKGEKVYDGTTEFSKYGARINTTVFKPNKVLSFTQASSYEWQWPTIATIYDSVNKSARFVPNSGSVYEIKLKYRADKAPDRKVFLQVLAVSAGISNPNNGYNSENVYVKSLAEISEMTDGWVEASAVFTTKSSNVLCLTLVSEATGWGEKSTGLEIYVDDVSVTERLDAYGIYFETNGGSAMTPVKCLGGESFPVFSAPTRDGYCFTGWYTDSDCKNPLRTSIMPDEDLIIYAGWAKIDGSPESLNTGFEESEYEKQVYVNDGTSAPVSDNSMSDSAVWYKNDSSEAYDGSGYIRFDDGDTVMTDSRSEKFMAISLYNPDGTPFCVRNGKRYKISLAYRHSGYSSNANSNFLFLVTNQTPGIGVNYGNSTVLYENGALGSDKHDTQTWGEFSTYVLSDIAGPVKLAMHGTTADQVLEIDNVVIEVMDETECIKVDYIQQNQNGGGRFNCGTRLGAPGDLLIAGDNSHIDGYAFDGWRTAEGELYTSNRFPESDMTLYASWRVADDASAIAPSSKEEIIIDFEDSDRAKAFYEDSANNFHPQNGVFLMVDDPDNAHSGNNYFQFYQCGHWMDEYLRRFKLYDPDTAGNQVYLEPNSVYKVSFWLNIESVGAGNLYLTTFSDIIGTKNWEIANENYITDTNNFEDFGKWVYYENTVVTGDDEDGDGVAATLGFTLYGGYLTAKLDDISIVKLKEVTVSFDTKGGSDVSDITQLSYDYAISPEDPTREGYEFTGWYTDEKLTNRFDFKTELIKNDVKLYAGWKAIEAPAPEEKEPIYKTVVDYETTEETVEIEAPDKELDEQITVADTDKVGKVNKGTSALGEENSNSLMWIIIAIAGGVVIVGGAVVTVIIIKKRKKRAR